MSFKLFSSVRCLRMKKAETLAKMSCKGACSKDTVVLTLSEIDKLMPQFPLWKLVELNEEKSKTSSSSSSKQLSRKFTARNFKSALSFVNSMAQIAEEEGHHPDFHLTGYRDVKINLFTHAIGGLSIYDFALAAKLDEIDVDYSPKWAKNNLVVENIQKE